MKSLILLSILFSVRASCQYIRCQGDIPFWIHNEKKQWKKVEPNINSYFEDFVQKIKIIKVGKNGRFPAAEIYTSGGISYKKINSELKVTVDDSQIILKFKKSKLRCEINIGTSFY